MKKPIISFIFAVIFGFSLSSVFAAEGKAKIILMIAEQNINGPRTGWWASEVDLSATEAVIASKLIEEGYDIIEPSELESFIQKDRAFRMVDLSDKASVKLGSNSKADYIVLGKAVASAGGNVPESSMRSCFANLSAKLIRVKDKRIMAYLDASGNSAHLDVITGGKEALVSAASNLAPKVIMILNKQPVDLDDPAVYQKPAQ
ncbi:MAG: hypothetical protein PHH68_03700 [Candidatus Omnitrophica bacterium]|jgi:hypothetical protein|nr:hypothetical protein [Candidatus Omnitrophota bacterium]MDD5079413.1 hypothetical protein [Candidatus Omnitrophota bacterium]